MKYTEILSNLKAALAVRILNQKAFRKKIGDMLGISVSMVSRKLSGEIYFTAEEFSVLCEELDIPVHEIFNGRSGNRCNSVSMTCLFAGRRAGRCLTGPWKCLHSQPSLNTLHFIFPVTPFRIS